MEIETNPNNARKSTRRCASKLVKTVGTVETVETVEAVNTVETARTTHTEISHTLTP